jgi:predicted RNA-binding protein YlqC (UPF0109 family)
MKHLIEVIVKSIVDFPENVDVTQIDGESTIVFELRVRKEDVGKVIGKKGRTINAIRTLVNATAAKTGMRAMLEIVEEDKEPETEQPEEFDRDYTPPEAY